MCVQMSFPANSPRNSERKWGKGKSENARFSLLMKNILSVSLKMSLLFASLLPFARGFCILIAEDSDPKQLVVSASCGKSGGSHQLMLRLSRPPGTQRRPLPANAAVPESVS